MRSYKNMLFLLLLVGVSASIVVPLQIGQQDDSLKDKPEKYTRQNFDRAKFASQFPIVDYYASEPADAEDRARRRDKSSRYDNRNMVALPQDSWRTPGATRFDDWDAGLDPLPVAQSDAIVVGQMVDAQAHLSTDKSGVYSEFTLRAEKVFKGDSSLLSPDNLIVAEREGGRVRFTPNDIDLYSVAGMGMPRMGHKYVVFLKRIGAENDYQILTGFEVYGKRIYPLDKRDSTGKKFDAYWDSDEATFGQILQDTIKKGAGK